MNVEYVVVWDGAHHGRDEDLLCDGLRIPEKAVPEPLRLGWGSARSIVADALSTLQTKALTGRELVAITGLTADQVSRALGQLREAGVLCSEPMPSGHIGSGAPRKYWRWPR